MWCATIMNTIIPSGMKRSSPTDKFVGFDLQLENSTVLDFWSWCYSIIANDPIKGHFAEWMVGKLLGYPMEPGGWVEGANWDLMSPEGIKIEVKAAAYWQAWKLRVTNGGWRQPNDQDFAKLTPIKFSGLYRRPSTGKVMDADFKSDLYVFCLQHQKDAAKWDAMDLSQWSFYMLPKKRLAAIKQKRDAAYKNDNLPKSFDLPLATLEKHTDRMTAAQFHTEGPRVVKELSAQKVLGASDE